MMNRQPPIYWRDLPPDGTVEQRLQRLEEFVQNQRNENARLRRMVQELHNEISMLVSRINRVRAGAWR